MKHLDFIEAIIMIVFLGLGIVVGNLVTTGYKDVEIRKVEADRDAAKDELVDAIKERDFWHWTLKGLAEGNQLEGVDLKGRPSVGN